MIRMFALLAVPLAAACPVPALAGSADGAGEAISAIYAPYGAEDPDWEAFHQRQPYSAATAALIEQWLAGLPEDEVTDLSSFDWFCECQDWDSKAFKLDIEPHGDPVDGRVELTARIDLGFDEARTPRFAMVQEGGEWKIDDLFSESFPDGLKAALVHAIENPWSE